VVVGSIPVGSKRGTVKRTGGPAPQVPLSAK
jgi:hypothetical protein